jgi:ribosomal protein S18 acetylase RimI-like enzyme
MSEPLAPVAKIRSLPMDDWRPSIEQVLAEFPVSQRSSLHSDWISITEIHAVDQLRLVAALRSAKTVGLARAMTQAGATALVWPPLMVPGEPPSTATGLLSALTSELQQSGMCLAQALLESETEAETAPFLAAGFTRTTELLYLVSLESTFPQVSPGGELQFMPFTQSDPARLARLVEATYQGTLDCPELNGVRRNDDVLAGYRATGVFHPDRWLIATHAGREVGCLLLADHPGANQWELVYVGLVPECRGRGWGMALVRQAQWLAGRAKVPQLVLAVDARNAPAIACYAQAGFVTWDRRGVYLKIFWRGQAD